MNNQKQSNTKMVAPDVKPYIHRIAYAPIQELTASELQGGRPRSKNEEKIDEILYSSLRDMGIVNPVVACKRKDGTYQLISGSRRLNSSPPNVKVPARVIEEELSNDMLLLLSYLVRMVDVIHKRDLSAEEHYETLSVIAPMYDFDDNHSFGPVMALLGLDSNHESYKDIKRVWELYRHKGLRQIIEDKKAKVGDLKACKVQVCYADAFAKALLKEHEKWAAEEKSTLDAKACKEVYDQVAKKSGDEKLPLVKVESEDGKLVFPGLTIQLKDSTTEDHSKAIQAIFWFDEMRKTLSDFLKVKSEVMPKFDFSNLARLVKEQDAYSLVPAKLKLLVLQDQKKWFKSEAPTAGRELNRFDRMFRELVEEVTSMDTLIEETAGGAPKKGKK